MPSSNTKFRELEVRLMKEVAVFDCAVRARGSENGSEIIAYIVPLGAFPEEAVRQNLQSAFPSSPLPDRYLLLSGLPFSSDGTLDEEALLRFEIVDERLARVWEQQLLSLPGVQQAAVVIEPRVLKLKPLHISDLLPNAEAFTAPESKQALPSTSEVGAGASTERKRVAISHGEPLSNPQQVPATLQQALKRAAETKPLGDITYVQADGSEVIHTYQELLEDAERILGGLRSLALGPGDKVIFQLDRNQ